MARIEPLLPAQPPVNDWEHTLAARWQRAESGYLAPLEVNLDLRLDDLIGIDRQRDLLAANTQQFVDVPANHVLLWGARGTGKSSLIRALLAEYAGRGLRLIEIERDHLADLPRVVELLSGQRQAFVLFCDDLSFEAGEGDYRVLKSVLDGSWSVRRRTCCCMPRRTAVTWCRAPERQRELADGGRRLHPNEAVEDKIALSDRFGLWLSFYPFSQQHYLCVVRHWIDSLAGKARLQWNWDKRKRTRFAGPPDAAIAMGAAYIRTPVVGGRTFARRGAN